LILTGALDATNPIENAGDVARGLANAEMIEIENAAHEALPVPAVQDAVVDFFTGVDLRGRRISAPKLKFATIAEALLASPGRGQRDGLPRRRFGINGSIRALSVRDDLGRALRENGRSQEPCETGPASK
jgi:hypothetical protein